MKTVLPTLPDTTALRRRSRALLLAFTVGLSLAILAGCGTRQAGGPGGYPVGGGDYRRDGPHDNPPADLDRVPDAVPRLEPLASGPNRPYVISGRRYVPDTSWQPYRRQGRASWYGRQFHGRPTSSGEPYDMYAMTAAHPTLPIPSYARVTHLRNGRSVIVRINDRGPFVDSRVIDLSYVAAHRLGTLATGTGDVVVELIRPDDIRAGTFGGSVLASQVPEALPVAPAAPTPPSVLRVANAAPIPVPAAPPAGVSDTAARIYLQVGAFGAADNAQALARKLSQHQGQGRLSLVQQSDDRLYRVRLGPYASRQQALADVDVIYRQTGIMPHLVGH